MNTNERDKLIEAVKAATRMGRGNGRVATGVFIAECASRGVLFSDVSILQTDPDAIEALVSYANRTYHGTRGTKMTPERATQFISDLLESTTNMLNGEE